MRVTETGGAGQVRAIIECVSPQVDGGRFPAKRIAGDPIRIEADIFTDGHDRLAALLCWRRGGEDQWTEVPMTYLENDRWFATITVPEPCEIEFTVAAWVDRFQTWRYDMQKRIEAGTDTDVDYQIGAELVLAAAGRAKTEAWSGWFRQIAAEMRSSALDQLLDSMMARHPDRTLQARCEALRITVDPVLARSSAWYEFFPRSAANDGATHGTFRECELRLPEIAAMGFDVVYLPPIHPIGTTFRKGRNNTLTPDPSDVGSPWAIGSAEGGHKSVHPHLGTLEDFRHLVSTATGLGLRIALDVAFQVSPDHPYAKEHPEWFRRRPDGTIQYAENPPKKYQDIYPFDFESDQWKAMWLELKSVFDFWIAEGVTIFRVDNPHTKAFAFWEWCIGAVKREQPEALFLAEAFTRPKVKYRLAKAGFSQSYTYFPWRHAKQEITDYFRAITQPPVCDFFRGNHWPNTPDILTEFLQTNGRTGFVQRFLLASAIAANYGIYGPAFELGEGRPLRQGGEEYLESEKFQLRKWDIDHKDSLRVLIAQVNRIRRENSALQHDTTLHFHSIDNEDLLAFSKRSPDGSSIVVVVINLDPRGTPEGDLKLSADDLGLDPNRALQMHELLSGTRTIWRAPGMHIVFESGSLPARIFAVRRPVRSERDFEYFL
ncbi:MAG: alpha-1,4-glucan--maltose-1-phosphate maltosyltransferase [Bryobacteraceae bacterium]|nr:alpha-1,4-glucan--maltose-1-phosphate maltosyltransferase [Bryobacteraceae bacterium]